MPKEKEGNIREIFRIIDRFHPSSGSIYLIESKSIKNIVCPKCDSPYCTYHYEYSVTPIVPRTRTKVHLLNPFKPFVEDVTTYYGGNVVEEEKYRCLN